MSLLLRLVVYAIVVFLVVIVYVSQKHDNARDTLVASKAMAGKWLLYTVIGVAVMLLLEVLFI